MDKIHACYLGKTAPWESVKQRKPAFWKCEACDFRGTQEEAIAHVTKNQFIVRAAIV